ncbi:hypothetical protein LDH75_005110 [Escherichia coli]|nr:hypothetical protein [Escherichia coli]
MKKLMIFWSCALFSMNCLADGWQSWVQIASVAQSNEITVDIPSTVRLGDRVFVRFKSPTGPSYNGVLRQTTGPSDCQEPQYNMELGGVFKIPPKISARLIDLEFVSVNSSVKQQFKFPDGDIGIYDISGTTPYNCTWYKNSIGKDEVYYGTGRTVVLEYVVKKLKGTGDDILSVYSAFTPTRRQSTATPWINGGSIQDNLGAVSTAPYKVVDFCSLNVNENEGIELNHGTLKPDEVAGNKVNKSIMFTCTSGAEASVRLNLSNKKGEAEVKLTNGNTATLNLSKTSVSIPRGGRESVDLSSTLNAVKKITAGQFEGSDVLTVVFN